MRTDRRLNGWILLSSILGIISGLVLLIGGAGVSVFGYLKPEELIKIKDLTFFINQEGLLNLQKQLLKGLLKHEFLFLFLGIIVAVIGLLVLIFAILSLNYTKKRKVVRRKVAVLLFTLVPIAIAGGIGYYLYSEFKVLTDVIKYVCYGVIGVFGAISLFNLLGIIFGRSEKFMSNDNNKYAFDNSSLRDARANVNNNVKNAQPRPNMVQAQNTNQYQNVPPRAPQQAQRMPSQAPNMQARPVRPMQPQQPRLMQQRPMPNARPQGSSRPVSPMSRVAPQQGQRMPSQAPNMQARPVRPMQPQQPRPVQPQRPQQAQAVKKYCKTCGKVLNPNETFCNLCGTKVTE